MSKFRFKNKLGLILLVFIFVVALFFRLRGLTNNSPFWVDEFSSAHQAKHILNYGTDVFKSIDRPPIFFENRNITEHFLIAGSFKIFGEHEWSARLPSAIVGAALPVALILLALTAASPLVGIGAALLTTFSYYEIAWSRQARGYMLQQLLGVTTLYFYFKILKKPTDPRVAVALLGSALLGLATHPLFVILLLSILLDAVIRFRKTLTSSIRISMPTKILTASLFIIGVKTFTTYVPMKSLGEINNLWYYHSFLWREYGLISILALLGVLIGTALKKYWISFVGSYVVLHLFAISFFISPYTSRYLNPIIPFIFLCASYAMAEIASTVLDKRKTKNVILRTAAPIVFILFIIANGDKFSIKPKQFYSVNHDFREIALVDYDSVYGIIKQKGDFTNGNTAIIETWPDRLYWYMGQEFLDVYLLQWKVGGMINGIPTGISSFAVKRNGEKYSVSYPTMGYVNEASDLQRAIKKYPKGFIFIDDASLPSDVIEYAEKNLKKELFLDHNPLDDNPYSVWPATLYSWGIK